MVDDLALAVVAVQWPRATLKVRVAVCKMSARYDVRGARVVGLGLGLGLGVGLGWG